MTGMSPYRLGRLTASRIPPILNLSPYGTPKTTMRLMVREAWGAPPEFEGNIATEWGHEHEQDGIDAYEELTGRTVTGQQQFTVHPVHDFIAMSPDGILEEDDEGLGVVEVKAPFRARFTHIDERPDYQAQMQVQMACLGAAWGDFVVWRPEITHISRLDHDPTWLDLVLPTLTEFHDEYMRIVADPELVQPHLDPLTDWRTDPEWWEAEVEYLEAKMEADTATRIVEDRKARLVELAAGETTRGAGLLLVVGTSGARLQSKKLYADYGITPEILATYKAGGGDTTYTVREVR